jgi:hypothetical protein
MFRDPTDLPGATWTAGIASFVPERATALCFFVAIFASAWPQVLYSSVGFRFRVVFGEKGRSEARSGDSYIAQTLETEPFCSTIAVHFLKA